jgi:nitrous oxidase accessory protein NosD
MFPVLCVNHPGRIKPISLRILAGVTLLGMSAFAARAATLCVNPRGTSGCKSTITAAVNAAASGDTVWIAPGTYAEEVVIKQSISLLGSNQATIIDATGLPNGIFIDGMASAPGIGVSSVVISGITVRNANFEGILVANASDVSLTGNLVMGNDKSLNVSAGTCTGIDTGFETNEGMDCGEGVHLMGVEHSTILRNEIAHNAGGILISDETGPNGYNLIIENFVHDNVYDCGITLASHAPAAVTGAKASFGVWYNTISRNASVGNGTKAAGAGVGIFAPGPGNTNTGNVVIDNDLVDNGATGVAMHNHASIPGLPPFDLNDNAIVGNRFSGNGPDNAGAPTPGPTGINILSMGPITGTVVAQNSFANEAIDLGFNAPATSQVNAHFNDFSSGIAIDNLGAGSVDATENWWNCPFGPGGGRRCATVAGTGVITSPWLFYPFETDQQ